MSAKDVSCVGVRGGCVRAFVILLMSTPFITACFGSCLPTDEVRQVLNNQLSAGDTRKKIELVLGNVVAKYNQPSYEPKSISSYSSPDGTLVMESSTGFSYTYLNKGGQFVNEYSTTIWNKSRCGHYQAISVSIRLDKESRLSAIEVSESYTMP